MTPYAALFLLAVVLSFLSLDRRFPAELAGTLFFLAVFFVVGFRYASVDYFQYEYIYSNVISVDRLTPLGYQVSELTPIEPGFALLILVHKAIQQNFPAFVFFFAAVSIAVKFRAFWSLSPFLLLSGLVYLSDEYFWKDLGQIRNALASAIVLWSALFVHRGQALRFCLAIAIAAMIHAAAIVAAPLYLVRYIKSPTIPMLALISALGVAMIGGVGLMLPEIASSLGFESTSRLIKYAESRATGGISIFGGTFWLHVTLSFFFCGYYRSLVEAWPVNRVLIPMYVFGSAMMIALIDYGIVAGRIREMLCVPAVAIVLPSTLLLFSGWQRLVGYGGVFSYCALWFYLMVRDQPAYQSVLMQ